jgi:hypothetical protein
MSIFTKIKVDPELAMRNDLRLTEAIKTLGKKWLLHPSNHVKKLNPRSNAKLI